MWDYDHDILSSLKDLFKRSNIVHKHGTRGVTHGNQYHNKVNTAKHGINSFKYQGIQILNKLHDLSIYQEMWELNQNLKNIQVKLNI